MSDAIRILAVGDTADSAQALRVVASHPPALQVMGPVSAGEAVSCLIDDPVHLVLVGMMGPDLPEQIERIRMIVPVARVLAVGEPSGFRAASVLAAGGSGLIAADLEPAEIREAVLRACAGELILDEQDLRSLVERIADPRIGAERRSLTARETEVLHALAHGASTTEIAESLGISPMTVQSHVKNMLAKLGVHSKVEAVRLAWREGLATVPA